MFEFDVEMEEGAKEHDERHNQVEERDGDQTPLQLYTMTRTDQKALGRVQANHWNEKKSQSDLNYRHIHNFSG